MQFLDCKITLSFSNQKIKDRSETLINKGIYEVKLKFIASLINDYNKVYYFFNHYRDEPEVSKLMYVYAHPDCYKYVVGKPLTVRSNGSCKYACDDKSAYKYVKYVFENYNQLPARNSAPMKKVFMEIGRYKIVSKKFKYPVQYKFKSLFTFLQEMKELGCNDKNLLGIINEQSV